MSTPVPFGTPPEEVMDYRVPDESEDPYRPIGATDPATGEYLTPDKPARIDVPGKCIALVKKQGPSGPMGVFTLVCTEGPFAGREFELYCSFSRKARFKVVETYGALGLPLDRPFPFSTAVGVCCVLKLQDEEYEGRWSAKIKSVGAHAKGAGFRGSNALPS